MATRGNKKQLALGPGYLLANILAATEPVDLVTPWAQVDIGWALLGYTSGGSEFNHQLKTSPVMVEEELDAVTNAPDGRTSSVTFDLAQITATNWKVACNGGTITNGNGVVRFEPPALGEEVRAMIGWEAEDHTERMIYRQCIMNGALKVARKKGGANATMACTFELELPDTGQELWAWIGNDPLRL
jgi:hypothetical protein